MNIYDSEKIKIGEEKRKILPKHRKKINKTKACWVREILLKKQSGVRESIPVKYRAVYDDGKDRRVCGQRQDLSPHIAYAVGGLSSGIFHIPDRNKLFVGRAGATRSNSLGIRRWESRAVTRRRARAVAKQPTADERMNEWMSIVDAVIPRRCPPAQAAIGQDGRPANRHIQYVCTVFAIFSKARRLRTDAHKTLQLKVRYDIVEFDVPFDTV